MWWRKDGDQVTLEIKVFPRSPRSCVGPVVVDRLQVRVHAPPDDGAANTEVVSILARAFRVPQSAVSILRGHTHRQKTVKIVGSPVEPTLYEAKAVHVQPK